MTVWIPAYIALGSNMGDSVMQVNRAFEALASLPDSRLIARSPLYQTRPMGPIKQSDFTNAVAGVLTQLSPDVLLSHLRRIEVTQGRVRAERWGPRSLDLDLLIFGTQRINTDALTVPHPGIAERNFVLAPLADIAPTLEVPGVGRVQELLGRLSRDGIRVVGA
jgi:2-amino-4-hydroxy-6-hydroxymethyldihydropteridine diphosphokinase